MYTLLILNPGHFHAALTLREKHPLVNDDIFVYAEEGRELNAFLELLDGFNRRGERPTSWHPVVYTGADYLEKLIQERRGEAVIIAGRNDVKIGAIHRLHEAGFNVLGDKPWLVSTEGIEPLKAVTAGPPLAMDIMLSRYEVTELLVKRLVTEPEVFGGFAAVDSGAPQISMDFVHHLCKTVDGRPLVRPAWYFDVRVEGDGIVDVPTHLLDRVLWMMEDKPQDFERDVELLSARRWATPVRPEEFTRITETAAFPPFLESAVDDGELQLLCNGEFTFRLHGVRAELRSEWHMQAPGGGGDTHQMRLCGERANVAVEMGPQTQFQARLLVRPHVKQGSAIQDSVGEALKAVVASWLPEFPGLEVSPAELGFEVLIPPALRLGHEAQFPLVLDEFLGYLERGEWPERRARNIRTKYSLTATASALAQRAEA